MKVVVLSEGSRDNEVRRGRIEEEAFYDSDLTRFLWEVNVCILLVAIM